MKNMLKTDPKVKAPVYEYPLILILYSYYACVELEIKETSKDFWYVF